LLDSDHASKKGVHIWPVWLAQLLDRWSLAELD
jgi:hypothetical protein